MHGQSKRYHHQYIGICGRLDTIQAAVLNVKLKYYEKDLTLRQDVAKKYTKAIEGKNIVSKLWEPKMKQTIKNINLFLRMLQSLYTF